MTGRTAVTVGVTETNTETVAQYDDGTGLGLMPMHYVADGNDVTQGSQADTAATNSTSSWSVIALLKGIFAKLAGSLTVTAASLPLPVGAALETGGNLAAIAGAQGAVGTGLTPPTGGTGILGFLSGIFNKLNTSVAVTGTVTANAGTSMSTAALALETGGNLATVATAQGVQGTGSGFNPPTGGSGVIGFLSGVYNALIGVLLTAPAKLGYYSTTVSLSNAYSGIENAGGLVAITLPAASTWYDLVNLVLGIQAATTLPAIPTLPFQIWASQPATSFADGAWPTSLNSADLTKTIYSANFGAPVPGGAANYYAGVLFLTEPLQIKSDGTGKIYLTFSFNGGFAPTGATTMTITAGVRP